jgi:hypothetical protein
MPMDTPSRSAQSPSQSPVAFDGLACGLMACALVFAITHQSFWIDETTIGLDAKQPTLGALWHTAAEGKTTELQSPFYIFYIWAYAKIFGTSEWTLRASNLLWEIPGLILFAQSFRHRRDRTCVALAILTNACIWYYTSEARVYGMLLGTSCLMFAAVQWLSRDDLNAKKQSLWLSVLLAALILQCGSSLLGPASASGVFLLILSLWPRQRLLEVWRCGPKRILATLCLLLAIAAYFFWTLRSGARPGVLETTDWKNICYIIYEHLGFVGLGPGRTDLRIGGPSLLRPYALALFVYALLAGVVTIRGVIELKNRLSFRRLPAVALAFALPVILLMLIGITSHRRVLGRHCFALMPWWVTLLGLGLAGLWRRQKWAGKVTAAAFVIMGLWSCLSVRLAVRHERDDYRDAAQDAREALARGQVVWWNAVRDGANYYEVPLATNTPAPGKAVLAVNLTALNLAGMTPPDLVVVSKPGLFDNQGGVATYLAEHHYHPAEQFASFTVWRP